MPRRGLRESRDDQGRHLRLLQHARGDHPTSGRRGTSSSPSSATTSPTTCASAGGTTASTAPSTTSTRSRATTTSPGSRPRVRSMLADCGSRRRARTCSSNASARSARTTASTRTPRSARSSRRAAGARLALAICSNWDWDLHEAIESAGLTGAFDLVVSSAWVGARKPHPRIYDAHAASSSASRPTDALFVGDTWTLRRRRPAGGRYARDLPTARASRRRPAPRPSRQTFPPTCITPSDLRAVVSAYASISRRDGRWPRRCRRASPGTAAAARPAARISSPTASSSVGSAIATSICPSTRRSGNAASRRASPFGSRAQRRRGRIRSGPRSITCIRSCSASSSTRSRSVIRPRSTRICPIGPPVIALAGQRVLQLRLHDEAAGQEQVAEQATGVPGARPTPPRPGAAGGGAVAGRRPRRFGRAGSRPAPPGARR